MSHPGYIELTMRADVAEAFCNEVAVLSEFVSIQNETLPEEEQAEMGIILEVRDSIQQAISTPTPRLLIIDEADPPAKEVE